MAENRRTVFQRGGAGSGAVAEGMPGGSRRGRAAEARTEIVRLNQAAPTTDDPKSHAIHTQPCWDQSL